jgi:hypothetical protein
LDTFERLIDILYRPRFQIALVGYLLVNYLNIIF